MSSNKAWVTLATNDSYSLGALVLAHSLKTVNTAHKLAILITPGVTTSMKKQIESVFDDVRVVDVLDSKDQTHLALMSRPELGVTFTKLHCWTLTNYEKCVFLDADTMVLQNCDELFEREELSAAPDPGWPDCFNSGVFVFRPSQNTFSQLLEFAKAKGSFDGGDQGLLNMFFKEWVHKDISKHLSFTYNVVWSSTYSYLPALKHFGQDMKIIHFIASSKPWLQSFNTETRLVTATSGGSGLQALLQLWWDLFCRHVHSGLSTEMIESRLSSCYSHDFPSEIPSNEYFSTYESSNEQQSHYTFVDPWDNFLVENEQINYEAEQTKVYVCQAENSRGDGNMVEEYSGVHCDQNVQYNHANNFDEEKQTRDHSFQNRVQEEYVKTKCEQTNYEHFEGVRQFDEEKHEQGQRNIENCTACSNDIPDNFNSNLNVSNCHPDTATHCEVPQDQNCESNGGLAGHFARVSLGEKTTDQNAIEDFLRRQSWEQGNMDYLGKDSFSNIWAKINATLGEIPEVKPEPVVKTPSPPEVVHSEEPKPLKSALKKTSTTTLPIESELIKSSEPPVKQLEKLDLSKNNVKPIITPDTPTVTSPTPPTTPAQAQELPKPESTEPEKEKPKSDISTETSTESVEPEQKPTQATKSVSQTTETVQEPQSVTDSPTQSVSNDPPVPPKRTNKAPNPQKNVQSSEKK